MSVLNLTPLLILLPPGLKIRQFRNDRYFCWCGSCLKSSHVHLDEVGEGVVDMGSFRQEKAAAGAHVIKEEQLLILLQNR